MLFRFKGGQTRQYKKKTNPRARNRGRKNNRDDNDGGGGEMFGLLRIRFQEKYAKTRDKKKKNKSNLYFIPWQ